MGDKRVGQDLLESIISKANSKATLAAFVAEHNRLKAKLEPAKINNTRAKARGI